MEAATGKIFEVRPTKFNLEGSASGHVHNRWYSEPLQVASYADLNLVHEEGTVTTDASGRFSDAPANAEPRLDGYTGPKVKVLPVTGEAVTREGAQVDASWEVVFNKDDDTPAHEDGNVAQSMLFHHTNAIIRYAKKYISSPWLEQQLTANANLARNCNAHWDGSTINFYSAGSGCANSALISDVIFHEWGHGLDHNTGGIQDGAFSEGYGDIISLLQTRSNILGIGFKLDGGHVRNLEPKKVYPADAGGGVHTEGLIIGSTFYHLYQALKDQYGDDAAIDKLSNYAFKMIFTASRYTDVYDALLVIDDDNADLSDRTPNFCLLNKVFSTHGLATPEAACELAAIDVFEIDDRQEGNNNGIVEPGESVNLWVSAYHNAPDALSGLKGVASISGVEGISIESATLTWDTIQTGESRRSNEPARFTVDPEVACGSSFNVKVNLSADTRSAVINKSFYVGKLIGVPEPAGAEGLPVDIPDESEVQTDLVINSNQWQEDTQILAAHLTFGITHTYAGDLTVALQAPDGTIKEVFKGSGSADDVVFDQDISALLQGLAGSGTWKLIVRDRAARDVGTLDHATLTLTPAVFECR